LEKLKRDIDLPLSAILTLNTFAHTVGAAGVGAVAQSIWGEASLTIVSGIVTIVILIGSEIIPKTIGAVYWQELAGPASLLCQWLTWILYPVVMMCQVITQFFRTGEKSSILSRVDVSQVAKFGYRDGLIREHEKDIIENLMNKDHLRTHEIMTPRERLVMVNESDPVSSIQPKSKAWHVSRLPIYDKDQNNVTGYVLKDEVLGHRISGDQSRILKSFGRKILNVHPDTQLKDLYRQLVSEDEHIAIVKDGEKVSGVVSMEDVLEELLGQEIVDESDRARGVLD